MEEENKEYGIRKINNKNWYKVYVNGANGKTFYKILLQQKNYDGTTKNYYQQITFKKTLTPPNDNEQIRLKAFVENIWGDDKYNPKYTYTILDYEKRQTEEQKMNEAFDEYNQTLDDNEIVNIDDSFLD